MGQMRILGNISRSDDGLPGQPGSKRNPSPTGPNGSKDRMAPQLTDTWEGGRPKIIIHSWPQNFLGKQKQTLSAKRVNSQGDKNVLR